MLLSFFRVEAGRYKSNCGRVEIKRNKSQQTYRADDIFWEVYVDGLKSGVGCDTLKEAKQQAFRRLQDKLSRH